MGKPKKRVEHGTVRKKIVGLPNGTKRGKAKKNSGFNTLTDDLPFRRSVEDGSRTIVDMAADGNCLFRSLSDQLYYDYGKNHEEVRSEVCNYIQANEQEFSVFLVLDEKEEDEDASNFAEYVASMREPGVWGGNLELVAAARFYRRKIKVLSAVAAFTIDHGEKASSGLDGPDITISYHENDHYNSVRGHSANRPPPPFKYAVSNPVQQMRDEISESMTSIEVTYSAEESLTLHLAQDDSNTSNNGNSPIVKPLKKNDLCRCGSGRRYKKCCLVAEKNKDRLLKWKAKHVVKESGNVSNEDADDVGMDLMDGNFKVLKI